MKNSLKMIISLVVILAVLFVMVNYAFAASALTPSNPIVVPSDGNETTNETTNTSANSSSNRVIITTNTNANANTSSNTSRANITTNTNTNRNANLPATGQEDIFVVAGMLVVLLGVSGYTYYKMKNANM